MFVRDRKSSGDAPTGHHAKGSQRKTNTMISWIQKQTDGFFPGVGAADTGHGGKYGHRLSVSVPVVQLSGSIRKLWRRCVSPQIKL